MTGTQQWRRGGPPLVWQTAPGEGAVFDPVTGETHFLSELPMILLTAVDRDWRGYASLIERIAGPTDLDAQSEAKILAALAYLETAELVESRHDPSE